MGITHKCTSQIRCMVLITYIVFVGFVNIELSSNKVGCLHFLSRKILEEDILLCQVVTTSGADFLSSVFLIHVSSLAS